MEHQPLDLTCCLLLEEEAVVAIVQAVAEQVAYLLTLEKVFHQELFLQ
jgi:hypothetical protein